MSAKTLLLVLIIVLSQAIDVTAEYHVISHCEQVDRLPRANCDIRLFEPVNIERISVTKNGENKERIIVAHPFSSLKEKTATLIVVDRSRRIKQRTLQVIREEIYSIFVNSVSDKRLIGIASFANELTLHAPVGSSRAALTDALNSIESDAAVSDIYRSVISAINYLETLSASRRHLIVITNGVNQGSGFSLADVISKARASRITLHGMGFIEKLSQSPELQGLRRIAHETNGIFVRADWSDKRLPQEISQQYFDTIESGTVISISTDSQSETQQFALSLGLASKETINTKINVAVANVDNPSYVADVWTTANDLATGLAVMFGLVAVAGCALYLFRMRTKKVAAGIKSETHNISMSGSETPSEDHPVRAIRNATSCSMQIKGSTTAVGESIPILPAWFVRTGSTGQIWPITKESMRIGRAKDCEICIAEPTVHRQHAMLVRTPEGQILLTDISGMGGNGIFVNDERVLHKELRSGDLVEFGAVHLRFLMELSDRESEPENFDSEQNKPVSLNLAELSNSATTKPELAAH